MLRLMVEQQSRRAEFWRGKFAEAGAGDYAQVSSNAMMKKKQRRPSEAAIRNYRRVREWLEEQNDPSVMKPIIYPGQVLCSLTWLPGAFGPVMALLVKEAEPIDEKLRQQIIDLGKRAFVDGCLQINRPDKERKRARRNVVEVKSTVAADAVKELRRG